MRIAVLIKEVPDTYGDRDLNLETGLLERDDAELVIDEIGERAVEAALAIQEQHQDSEITVDVVSMSPESSISSIRRPLAMGAGEAVHISDPDLLGADLTLTAEVLAAALRTRDYDLIVTGDMSTDGTAGLLPAMLAEHLDLPYLTQLSELEVTPTSEADSAADLTATRSTEEATYSLTAQCPAIVSITEAFPDARFPNFKGIMGAKKKPVHTLSLADLDIDPTDFSHPRAIMTAVDKAPARQAGTIITDDGSAAQQIFDYLVDNKLV